MILTFYDITQLHDTIETRGFGPAWYFRDRGGGFEKDRFYRDIIHERPLNNYFGTEEVESTFWRKVIYF